MISDLLWDFERHLHVQGWGHVYEMPERPQCLLVTHLEALSKQEMKGKAEL